MYKTKFIIYITSEIKKKKGNVTYIFSITELFLIQFKLVSTSFVEPSVHLRFQISIACKPLCFQLLFSAK